MSQKVVVLSERHIVLIRELLDHTAPCSTRCDATYTEYAELRRALDPSHTHKHVEREGLSVRYIGAVREVGCDRPLALFEGQCGETYARPVGEFEQRFGLI